MNISASEKYWLSTILCADWQVILYNLNDINRVWALLSPYKRTKLDKHVRHPGLFNSRLYFTGHFHNSLGFIFLHFFFEFPFGYHIILKTKVIVEIWAHGHTATTKSGEDKHKGQAIMQIINTCKHNEILDRLSEPLQFWPLLKCWQKCSHRFVKYCVFLALFIIDGFTTTSNPMPQFT